MIITLAQHLPKLVDYVTKSMYVQFILHFNFTWSSSYRVLLWKYLCIYCYSIISEVHEYVRVLLIDWLRIGSKRGFREEIGMFRGQIEFIRFSFLSELIQDTSSRIKNLQDISSRVKTFFQLSWIYTSGSEIVL